MIAVDTRTLQAFMGHRSIANMVVYTAVAISGYKHLGEMMKHFAAVYFVAMTLGSVAHAETGMTSMGVGSRSCGELIAAVGKTAPGTGTVINDSEAGRLHSENVLYQEWLMGFFTGMNAAYAGKQQIEGLDVAGIDLWMRNWCIKHPTKKVFEGAVALVEETLGGAAARKR